MTEKEGDDTIETEEETTNSAEETEGKIEEGVEEAEDRIEETVEEAEDRAEEIEESVEERAEGVLNSVDENVDRLLSEILDTRSRVAVYVGLRQKGKATPDEVAEETGLYPDKVERVLEDLEDEEVVERTAETEDEYKAISPTELVRRVPESVGGWLSDLIGSGDEDEKEHSKTTEIDVE